MSLSRKQIVPTAFSPEGDTEFYIGGCLNEKGSLGVITPPYSFSYLESWV
jgi:hypothetical protein